MFGNDMRVPSPGTLTEAVATNLGWGGLPRHPRNSGIFLQRALGVLRTTVLPFRHDRRERGGPGAPPAGPRRRTVRSGVPRTGSAGRAARRARGGRSVQRRLLGTDRSAHPVASHERQHLPDAGSHGHALGVRIALTAQGTAWGYLVLLRTTGRFTAAETALLDRAAPLLAAALRDAVIADCVANEEEPSAPAVLVLNAADHCVSLTDQAREYLGFPASQTPPRLPEAMHIVAARARAGAGSASAVIPAQAGLWLSCHSGTLDSAGSVAITLHPARLGDVGPVVLAAYGLTAREREIAIAVLRGECPQPGRTPAAVAPAASPDDGAGAFVTPRGPGSARPPPSGGPGSSTCRCSPADGPWSRARSARRRRWRARRRWRRSRTSRTCRRR